MNSKSKKKSKDKKKNPVNETPKAGVEEAPVTSEEASASADAKEAPNAEGPQKEIPGVASVEDREVVCPSCFRFTGTYEKCPYCGANVYKRLSVRFFRWGSLIFALVGILLLWMAARGIKAPTVKINSLEPSMSMGFVRVVGKITNEPRLHPEWKSLYLRVVDDTGELSVNAFSEIATKVFDKMSLSMGDEISVQGMVKFRGKLPKPSLLLQSPEHITIVKKGLSIKDMKTVPMTIDKVTEGHRGTKIILEGLLEKSEVLGFGAYRGVLTKDGASIVVWITPQKWKKFFNEGKQLLRQGATLQIRGLVETYYDKATKKTVLEIIPDGYEGCIVELSAPPAGTVAPTGPVDKSQDTGLSESGQPDHVKKADATAPDGSASDEAPQTDESGTNAGGE
jgi:DNA/RNA endonuclease YhcR with UshA esterase domain